LLTGGRRKDIRFPGIPVTVERADFVSIAAGVIIVIIIAAILNPPSFTPEIQPVPTPVPTASPATLALPEPTAVPGPVRIAYETDYKNFPTIHLPGNLSTFGASDLPWTGQESRVIAYVEGSTGGITRTFSSPSSVWRINCTTHATLRPQYARFRMALVDAHTGKIVQGAELMYPGNIFKTVERQNREFYMIIGCDNIDQFIVTLEVPQPVV
jgi:hypothetical protein